MNEVVLDASVVVKWFRAEGEQHVDLARSLRTKLEAGDLKVFAPRLLCVELVNVAGRRWLLKRETLVDFVRQLTSLKFEFREPHLESVAEWTARGLSAYDASYVALAESYALKLVTDDQRILSTAPGVALHLAGASPNPIRDVSDTHATSDPDAAP